MGIEQHFIENKKVLVLGSSGGIGRGMVHVLAKNNEVHALDCFPDPAIKEQLSRVCEKLWQVDILEPDSLKSIPTDFDVVINELVQWGHHDPLSWDTFYRLLRTNSFLPGRLMEHFAESGAKLVFGSTGGVYVPSKDKNDLNREGETCLSGGDSIYEDTKLAGDAIVRYFSAEHGIPATILRYYWPVAPYQGGGHAGETYRAWLEGKPTQVSEANPWYHNITYIADLVYATCAAANRVSSPPATYNVAGHEIASHREVDLAVAEEMGIDPIFEEADRERDLEMYLADVTLMSQELWKPRFGLKEAVPLIIRAVKEDIREPQDWMFECE